MVDLIGPASASNSTTTRPALYRVFGAIDTWFRDCSTPQSQDGTAYQADFFNGLLGQLRTLIRGNGALQSGVGPVVPEVNTSDTMLLTAVQLLIARGQPNAGADTGSADALAVGPPTPWPEYVKGARIWVVKNPAAGPNASAAPTIAVSNLAAVTIVRRDGSALLPGDLPNGVAFCAEYDGAYFRLVSLTWGEIAGAVQSGKWVYGAATGTGNAAAVTLFPVQVPVDGQEILVKWPAANTAAAPTLNVSGVGAKAVVRQGAGQVQPGDLAGYVPLVWDATLAAWRVNGFVASDFAATPVGKALVSKSVAGTYSFTVPVGVYWVYATVVGGGGGGSGVNTSATKNGAGGGAGGTAAGWIAVTPGQVIAYVVGAGSAGVAYNANSASGGTSSIGSIMQATGGGGVGNSGLAGGQGGVGTGGQLNLTGGNGGDGNSVNPNNPGGNGGASSLGGGGRAGTQYGSLADGQAPGSGGGGIYSTQTNSNGGSGAAGYVSFQY